MTPVTLVTTRVPAVPASMASMSDKAPITAADPDVLLTKYEAEFAAGSMLPKVIAACDFAKTTGKPAAIGALADIDAMLAGTAGTRVTADVEGVVFAAS